MPESPTLCSLPLTLRLEPLPPAAIDKVHQETLEVLEQVGVGIASPQLQDALEEVGARVDRDQQRVRFPADLVESALEKAPRSFVLGARRSGFDLVLDGAHGYLSVDGCAAEVLDVESGQRRPSTRQDLALASRLADALPEISLLWQPVAARNVPPHLKSLHELHTQLANSTKHIQMMTAVTPQAASGIVEIARLVAGGSDALRRHPILSAFECSLSPLAYDDGALEAALVFAEAGVPCGFVVMPIAGATAPVTVAGALVQTNAEVLAGITMLQSLAPGASTFYGACTTVMDLRTGAASCGGPEDLFFQMACAQLARHYGVPSCIGTFATGAKSADWQAGLENGLSALASCLAGADLLCGAGLLHGASLFSLEEMVLDCEAFRLLRHFAGIPGALVQEESSLEVLSEVGPGGHFLSHPQTLERMRDQWLPEMFDRRDWDEWLTDPEAGPWASATERVRDLLQSHHPEPLPPEVDTEILHIIDTYEQQGDNHHG